MFILSQLFHTLYTIPTYLKSYNKFYDDISIAKGLLSEDMFKFIYLFILFIYSLLILGVHNKNYGLLYCV